MARMAASKPRDKRQCFRSRHRYKKVDRNGEQLTCKNTQGLTRQFNIVHCPAHRPLAIWN